LSEVTWDEAAPEDWATAPALYVCLNSLPRMPPGTAPPDVLVLDEFVGLYQAVPFCQARAALAWDWLRRAAQARHVLVADALMDDDAARALAYLREDQTWFHNTWPVYDAFHVQVLWGKQRQANSLADLCEQAIREDRMLILVASHRTRLVGQIAALHDRRPHGWAGP
jgi:hypothetical protein